jgi:hypothetical protein
MLESLVFWNFRRLVRKPVYGLAVFAIALLTLWTRGFAGMFPGVWGVAVLSAMTLGFAAPAVGSVATEARYLLSRSSSRAACLVVWTSFAIALMAGATIAAALVRKPPSYDSMVFVSDAATEALLAGRGFPVTEAKNHPEVHLYTLLGLTSLLYGMVVLSAMVGLFTRLGEVETGLRSKPSDRLRFWLLSKGPALALLTTWLLLAARGRATYVAILGYLHPSWALGVFGVAAIASATRCWHAWSRGDVQ